MLTRQQQHRPRPSVLLSAIALLTLGLFTPPSAHAVPHPRDDLHDAGYGYLRFRDCAAYCGYGNRYCCGSDEVCYTTLNPQGQAIAGCSTAHGGAGYAWYTTTWTETETFTSTISSHFPGQTTAIVGGGAGGGGGSGGQCVPQAGTGQIACGPICCANDQYCAYAGQCLPNSPGGGGGGGGGGGVIPITTTMTSNGQVYTTQYSAPYRVTSGVTITQTAGAGASGVFATSSPTPTGNGTMTTGTASKLSGGAIAGIVIGSIAGVALLLLLCFCCLVRGLWHGLMALLGMGGKKDKEHRRRSETIIEEERYSRHGSVHARRDNHTGGWFGGAAGGRGGGRPSTVASRKEKKSGGAGGLLGMAGVLGTAALLLGLKKDKDNKKKRPVKTRSDVSSSYMSYDSYSDPSSVSRDTRRTRESRGSRGTRTTRVSRPPSAVRH